MKKFELTTNTKVKLGRTLIQIKAAFSFGTVKEGDLGGWVEKESSLGDDVWIYEDAEVFANAKIMGGEIMGGEIWGGEIMGGVIRGGEIWGGVIWGGVIRGGVIKKSSDYITFCSIGSDSNVLTAYKVGKEIEVVRGCFRGTLKEFETAVKEKHGKNQHAIEYGFAIKIIKARFSKKEA